MPYQVKALAQPIKALLHVRLRHAAHAPTIRRIEEGQADVLLERFRSAGQSLHVKRLEDLRHRTEFSKTHQTHLEGENVLEGLS